MEGAPKRQVNAEEMLAELKRVVESSTPAPHAPLPSASTAPKSSSPGRESPRSQIAKGSDRPAKADADKPIGPQTDLQKSTRPSSRRRKLIAGGLALGGAAAFFAGAPLMNQVLNRPARELSAAATESPVKPQNEQPLEDSSSPGVPMQGSPPAAPLQTGALKTGPDAGPAPATGGLLPAQVKAEVDAPHLAPFGLDSAPPASTPAPLDQAPALVTSHRIGPDGAPIATAPSTPTSTDSAHPAETPNPAPAPAASQIIRPDGAPIATAPTPASTDSAHPAEAPKTAAPSAPSQVIRPDGAPIATTAPGPAPTDAAPLTETSKPNATPTAHVSNESTQPSTRKIDSKKKPLEKASLQKPLRSPTPPVKPSAQAERQPTEPARPKEAEKAPSPAQSASNPTALAPVAAPSVQQRVADGVTHAFGYLVHLRGALVPHLGGSNPDTH
jgi:hypothetical protein